MGLPGLGDLTGNPVTSAVTSAVSAPQAPGPQGPSVTAGLPNGMPNVTTPGAATRWTSSPIYYGVPTHHATRGVQLPNGDVEYLPGAQSFNGPSTHGWYGYEEYSVLCFVRGVTCVNWHFLHPQTGGPDGGGFLRINGTSLALAPCTPQEAIARWNSPLFTYDSVGAKNWTISFDNRQTDLLLGDGHSAYSVQLLDSKGHVVTTAYGPTLTFPYGNWRHVNASFDGSKLVYGENYRISITVDVMHAETAGNWGNEDFDNIKFVTSPNPLGDVTVSSLPTTNFHQQICRAAYNGPASGLGALLNGSPADLCPLTNEVGGALGPILDVANQALKTGPLAGLLDRLGGAFAVVDLTTGQATGWLIGKEAVPSSDPRNLLMYVRDGTVGEAGNFVIMFIPNTVGVLSDLLNNPVPNVMNVVQGQLENLRELLADPGRLLDIRLDWTAKNLEWLLDTILKPLNHPYPPSAPALGGKVWWDTLKTGVYVPAIDPPVSGVTVHLTDTNGRDYGTQVTGPNGKYLFRDLDQTSDPVSYFVKFTLPNGDMFTREYAPGTYHWNTSSANPVTGMTDRITLFRNDSDLNWNAGVLSASQPGGGNPGGGNPGGGNPGGGNPGGGNPGGGNPGGGNPGGGNPGGGNPGGGNPGGGNPGGGNPGGHHHHCMPSNPNGGDRRWTPGGVVVIPWCPCVCVQDNH